LRISQARPGETSKCVGTEKFESNPQRGCKKGDRETGRLQVQREEQRENACINAKEQTEHKNDGNACEKRNSSIMIYRVIYPVLRSKEIRDTKNDAGPKGLSWTLVIKGKKKRDKGYPGKKKEVYSWEA
jgi:hypothetical protein